MSDLDVIRKFIRGQQEHAENLRSRLLTTTLASFENAFILDESDVIAVARIGAIAKGVSSIEEILAEVERGTSTEAEGLQDIDDLVQRCLYGTHYLASMTAASLLLHSDSLTFWQTVGNLLPSER